MVIQESEFDEEFYLMHSPDVLDGVKKGKVKNAYTHYKLHGEKERRPYRKLIDKEFSRSGFKSSANKLYFYALTQNPEFVRLLLSEDYKEALAVEMEKIVPKIILDTLK